MCRSMIFIIVTAAIETVTCNTPGKDVHMHAIGPCVCRDTIPEAGGKCGEIRFQNDAGCFAICGPRLRAWYGE